MLAFGGMVSYAGSPALSSEARAKVLQTFRHTLSLAQSGKVDEALLGCDFILKMDGRFAPARALLDSLRTAAPGAAVDVNRFSQFLGFESAVEEPSGPAGTPSLPTPGAPPPLGDAFPAPASPPPAAHAAGLDDLVFGDEPAGGARPSAAPAPKTPSPQPAPPPPPSFAPAPGSDPFAGLDDLSLSGGAPSLAGSPLDAAAAFQPGLPPPIPAAASAPGQEFGAPEAPEAPAPAPAPRPASAVQSDVRITQFLKQGDEAFARGNAQEAIDLWSRVFLIDLSNEEASRRIDSARESQAESARKIDMLLSEGVQSYEAGDLAGARNKFLDVLALSENDATARGYLNQIDAALSTPATSGSPAAAPTPDSDFMRNEIEAPHAPSFADEIPRLDESAQGEGAVPERAVLPKRRGRVDLRVLIAGRTHPPRRRRRRDVLVPPRRPPGGRPPAPRRPRSPALRSVRPTTRSRRRRPSSTPARSTRRSRCS